jgi:hypothetical protein
MIEWRIKKHPILSIPKRKKISFYWNNQKLQAYKGEVSVPSVWWLPMGFQ